MNAENIVKSKSPCVVISQPMYFPWAGMLEQIRLCDNFVFYNDVQYSRGFFNRVQIKTDSGMRWLTVPLKNLHRGQLINQVQIDNGMNWQRSHRDQLRQAYSAAPYKNEMLDLIDKVLSEEYQYLDEISKASMFALINYFGLDENKLFMNSSQIEVTGKSSQRLIEICVNLGAASYLTGHGASKYLEHSLFEEHNIEVNYIDYGLKKFPQLYDSFTPYVTALDLVANCGQNGKSFIEGCVVPWRKFIKMKTDSRQE